MYLKKLIVVYRQPQDISNKMKVGEVITIYVGLWVRLVRIRPGTDEKRVVWVEHFVT